MNEQSYRRHSIRRESRISNHFCTQLLTISQSLQNSIAKIRWSSKIWQRVSQGQCQIKFFLFNSGVERKKILFNKLFKLLINKIMINVVNCHKIWLMYSLGVKVGIHSLTDKRIMLLKYPRTDQFFTSICPIIEYIFSLPRD